MSIELLDDDAELKEQKKYDDFMLAEYTSIATAYSNTISTIATFFRNYLVIVGLPIPILGFVLTQLSKPGAPGQPATIALPKDLTFLVPLSGFVIGALGFFLMVYIINLRLDALLYARTVNGIRKYFYNRSPLAYHDELQTRVLPRTVTQPRYFERMYFLPVIGVFTLLNTLYPVVGLAWYLQGSIGLSPAEAAGGYVSLFLASLLLHGGTYRFWAWYRDTRYLRKFIIGVDIDGVLNKHRDTFCTKLWELLGKSVWADQITAIPVHECAGLNVTEADEHAIFNHPSYWRDLAPADRVAEIINKLRNVFGYKIFVFTHRPWPEPKSFPRGQEQKYLELWWNQFLSFWGSSVGPGVIETLTRQWLKANGISYDRLVVEKGNVHTAGPHLLTRNRFTLSERWGIRIFVEDDLFKAIKLANICEVVFLINHPYNQTTELPRNVIRVSGWKDIYEYIRQKL